MLAFWNAKWLFAKSFFPSASSSAWGDRATGAPLAQRPTSFAASPAAVVPANPGFLARARACLAIVSRKALTSCFSLRMTRYDPFLAHAGTTPGSKGTPPSPFGSCRS